LVDFFHSFVYIRQIEELIVEERLWTLLARQFGGEATLAELQELEQLLAQDPALKRTAKKMLDAWHDPGKSDIQKALSSFAKIDAQIQQNGKTIEEPAHVYQLSSPSIFKKYRIAIAVAASIVLLAGAWFIFFNNNTSESKKLVLQEITTPLKSIREIKMPDGSTVWLNEGSKMEYGDQFNDKIREVWLTGEAYFDVVKNKKKPFIIHAGRINVKVLGTAFNIKSYPGEKNIETSLIRGSVEVTLNDDPSKIYILKPDQKLVVPVTDNTTADSVSAATQTDKEVTYSKIGKISDNRADTIIAEASWVDKKLAFYASSFKDLAVLMERRYDVSFVFRDKQKEALVFTGVFYKQTLPEALRALSLTAPFNYRIQDSTVYILK